MNGMDIVLMLQKRNLLKVFHDEDYVNAIIENIKILYTLKKTKKEGEAVEGKRRTMNGMDIVLMLQKRNLLKVFHDEDYVNAIIENIKILYTLKKMKKEGEAVEVKTKEA
jgi:hypothetical protein